MGIFQQFPYSNFHEMNLDQIIKIMREMQDEWANTKNEWASYKDFIDNYFENLDVSEEVLAALRTMAETGELNEVVDPVIIAETIAWLADHITQPTTPAIDTSLTIEGAAADAKAAGDAIIALNRYTSKTIDKTLIPGFYSAGGSYTQDPSNVTFTTEEFFAVNSAITVRFIGQLTTIAHSWCAINYFDRTKTFISRDVFCVDGERTYANAYLTPPANAYYARFSYRVNAEWTFDYYYIFDENSYELANGLSPENFMLGRLVAGEILKTGAETLSRVSSIYKIKFDVAKSISVKSGYAFAVHTFDENGAYESDSGWITTEYWIPANKEFRIMIRVNPADDSVIANIDNCVNALRLFDKYGNDNTIIRGGFSSGKIQDHATRAVTPTIKKYNKMVKVSAMTGYQVAIVELRNDTLFYDYYWRNTWFMPANSEFRLLIQNTDTSIPVDLTATCFTIEEFEKEPSNANIKGVNHRGFIFAPENTLTAYQLSIEAGFRIVETDVMFTSDSVPVLLHDETINRTARNLDYSTISSEIRIDSITYAQALGYTFNQGRGWYREYIPIPTFEEFISFCKYNSLQAYIELKTASNLTDARAAVLVDTVKRYGMLDKVTWISFNETLLAKIRVLDPDSRVGFLYMGDDMATAVAVVENLGGDAFLEMEHDTVTDAKVNYCINNDITFEMWGLGEISDFSQFNPYITKYTNNYYHS